MSLRKPLILLIFHLMYVVQGIAQSSVSLEGYIEEALSQNQRLKDAVYKLDIQRVGQEIIGKAKLPEASFGLNYSLAEGGRQIEIPVGDLVNPVYSTLNKLTQSNTFPQIENVSEQLLPNNFYDMRFRVRQPLLRAEIELNRRLMGTQISIQTLKLQAIKREIAKEVKVAYFTYLQTEALLGVLDRNKQLLEAQRRVQEGLVRNAKAIPSVLTRTASELAKLETQFFQARMQVKNAALYFNYLLGRDASAAIQIDTLLLDTRNFMPVERQTREELMQIQEAQKAAALMVDLEEARRRPTIGAQLDFGTQGFDFKWGGYALLGINLEVPLWNGGRQKLQIQKAKIESERVNTTLLETERAVKLESEIAHHTFLAAQSVWESFPVQLHAAQRYYQETLRRYSEGLVNELELLDAQNQWNTLEVQQTIAYYTMWIRFAEMERAWAAYPLDN